MLWRFATCLVCFLGCFLRGVFIVCGVGFVGFVFGVEFDCVVVLYFWAVILVGWYVWNCGLVLFVSLCLVGFVFG